MSTSPSAAPPRHPLAELLQRYAQVFRACWQMRAELAGPARLADEVAFLPAALSLQETPPHPAPRRAAWALCGLFVVALAWSVFSKVDIVAVAPGRIVVGERTKVVQPLETSVVKRLHVRDGEAVRAGQLLIELDATAATADGTSVEEQWQAARSERHRAAALLRALATHTAPRWPDPAPSARDQAQLDAEWADMSARLAKFDAEHARRAAELATVKAVIAKLDDTLPMARQREADYKNLVDQGFMAGHAGQDRLRERIELERDRATQQARMAEAQAAMSETASGRSAYLAEATRLLNERQAQAALKQEQLAQERHKTEQRNRLTRLTASVDGTVQQLAVHTEGGIVTAAQTLMVIVPKDADVTAEVVVDNKDIGFVHAGQHAVIKLETFPFTRYGTIDATVGAVTADAVNDEKRGAIFPASLTLNRRDIAVDGKRIRLSPGMNVTAEITTGQQRVIEYVLSPVQRWAGESLRER